MHVRNGIRPTGGTNQTDRPVITAFDFFRPEAAGGSLTDPTRIGFDATGEEWRPIYRCMVRFKSGGSATDSRIPVGITRSPPEFDASSLW